MTRTPIVVLLVLGAALATTGVRHPRSGGFPKFPSLVPPPTQPPQATARHACGTRGVVFSPPRSGSAAAKIVGGAASPYGAYPWQVELLVWRPDKRTYEHLCGGAVIGSLLVLTAAHCVSDDVDQRFLRIAIGQHRRNKPDAYEQTFRASSIVIHPNFRKSGPYSNDIAVIRVKDAAVATYGNPASTRGRAIQFDSHVRAICLPGRYEEVEADTWCTVTGWGAQDFEDKDSLSVVLKAASVPVVPLNQCRSPEVYGGRRQAILDSMICAGSLEGGTDACGGDSGGPLACESRGRHVLMGVVSWGDGCGKKNRPGVYTKVSHFIDWIDSVQRNDV
ncbi:coagulation factor XII-like isoform X2 [Neocloeon triangulifer]|uniref:coagulation factor XII-like isoform X2 n=1 Tax=Neocloeon triangulifer TaxID=2078957 RepID=UPI00286F6CC2|nr:coagulation factor XII-like isoform X2 [Neocloeon triangulifer]